MGRGRRPNANLFDVLTHCSDGPAGRGPAAVVISGVLPGTNLVLVAAAPAHKLAYHTLAIPRNTYARAQCPHLRHIPPHTHTSHTLITQVGNGLLTSMAWWGLGLVGGLETQNCLAHCDALAYTSIGPPGTSSRCGLVRFGPVWRGLGLVVFDRHGCV